MEFGMPTLVECRDLEECCALCSRLKLRFVEINMSFPQYQPEKMGEQYLRGLIDKYGVYFTVHMDESMNPFDFNERIAQAYTQNALDVICLARKLNIPRLNLHLLRGVYVTLPGKRIYLNEVYQEEYLRKVRRFGEICEEALEGSNTLIVLENTDDGFDGFHQLAADCLLQFAHFGLTLDVGHARMKQDKDIPFFDARENRLKHMHIHNVTKGPHMPLDEGEVDIEACIERARRTKSTAVIEVKTIEGLERSVKWLDKHR